MLKIRLQRVGRKHEPVFRLVLTDSKNSTKSGKYLETLGSYDSRRGDKSDFKSERISYWMGKGAQVSTTVHNLLIDKKVISGKKLNALPLKKAIVKDQPVQAGDEVATPEVSTQSTSSATPTEAPAPATEAAPKEVSA